MNDNEISEMIKKAQSMINNNQVPPEIMQMANQIKNDASSGTGANSNASVESLSNNDMSQILKAVQPYMNNSQPQNPQFFNSSQQPMQQSSSPLDQITNIARIAEIIKLLK